MSERLERMALIKEVSMAITSGRLLQALALANSPLMPNRHMTCSEMEEFVKRYRENGQKLAEQDGCTAYSADGVKILHCGHMAVILASLDTAYVIRCAP